MGFNRPEAKRLAKAAMRNTNPNPMLVTLVFVHWSELSGGTCADKPDL